MCRAGSVCLLDDELSAVIEPLQGANMSTILGPIAELLHGVLPNLLGQSSTPCRFLQSIHSAVQVHGARLDQDGAGFTAFAKDIFLRDQFRRAIGRAESKGGTHGLRSASSWRGISRIGKVLKI